MSPETAAMIPLLAASVPAAPLSGLFISFLVYSFAGWLWESTVCAMMNQGRFANSGFLLGPICPIYGVGALACWLFLREIPDVVPQFLVSGLLCCALEYAVSVVLEATTGARFWDYEDKPANINGRVCLYGFLMFGAGAVLICRVLEPALLGVLASVPVIALEAVAVMCAVGLAVDLVFAMASWRRLSTQLESLRTQIQVRIDESMGEASERMLEALPEPVVEGAAEVYERTRDAAGDLVSKLDPRAVAAGVGQATQMLRDGIAEHGGEGRLAELRAAGEGARLRRAASNAQATEWLNSAAESLVSRLGRRDLRFFNAFPRMRMKRYESVINRAGIRERVRELFER